MIHLPHPHIVAFVTALSVSSIPMSQSHASEMDPHIELNLGFNTRNPTENIRYTTWVPSLHVLAELNHQLLLTADWGLTLIDTDALTGTNADALNPFVALHFTSDFGRGRLRAGAGLSLPVADGEGPRGQEALATAAAMRGNWDPWLYEADTMSFVVPARLEFYPSQNITIAADFAAFMLIPFVRDSTQIGLQGAAEGIYHLRPLNLGVRIQGVRVEDDNPATSDTQASIEPFVGFRTGDVSLKAKFTINLSQPEGFAFDEDGIWGLHFSGAYYF
ncbi:MAG: hypothetical protein KTR25_19975 [Myxococcales bacterium]|nr:hypothetical protein [Myxococcales bacterium]